MDVSVSSGEDCVDGSFVHGNDETYVVLKMLLSHVATSFFISTRNCRIICDFYTLF